METFEFSVIDCLIEMYPECNRYELENHEEEISQLF